MPDSPPSLDLERSGADTLCSPPPAVAAAREACLVHIYPTGPSMGKRYPLSMISSLLIGRASDCAILIDDNSVSRKHARIDPTPDGYHASDLGSTNGTFVNDQPVERCALRDGDYLRVGNCIYRFLAGGNIEAEYHEEIYRLAIVDGLTDIPNKRYLIEFLNRELSRSMRHHRPLAVILFDIDCFKSINDRMGHLCGDYVLREVACRLRDVIRAEELLARYGGEEFVAVLPESTREQALVVADRLRLLVSQTPFRFDGEENWVTISLGVAAVDGGEAIEPHEIIKQADDMLYEAKDAGRNRVAG